MTIINFLTQKLTSLFARVLFVILAFAVMIVSVSIYVNSMLRNQLQREATEMLTQTGFNIKAEFIEPQTTLIAISDVIREMILRDDSFEEVLDTLRSLSRAMKTKPDGFTFYSIFGYFEIFDGVFFDTEGWAGDENYDPTDRPWYVTAVEAGDKLAITPLYYGFSSNAYIVTYVRRLFDEEGNPLGVLCMNMPTDRIKKYVDDMRITENSYGYLETEKFDIITHPNPDFIGKNVRDIHSSMLEVAEAVVMNSGVVYQGVSRNNAGFLMELYGMELDNGWILCFLTPVNEYYQRVTNMMLMLSIMGILMAGVLIFIFLSLERASKKVHEESRQKSVTLSEIEKKRETDERTQVMLNATPLSIDYWDKNFNIITCSEETVRLFGVKNKQEYVDKFFNFIPECQPDGSLSKEKVYGNLTKAYTKGYHRFEWVYKKSDGELIPSEVTLVRVQHKGEYNVLGFVKDLRKHKQMMNEIEQRDELLNMVNSTAVALLATKDEENLLPSIIEGMELLGKAVNADRVQIWKNEMIDNKLQFVHKCEWLSEFGRQKTPVPIGLHFPLSSKPEWEKKFYRNECINGPLRKLSQDSQDLLAPFGIKSIVNIPLFLQDKFWGFFSLDDCREERTFSADEIDILRSGGLLIASAFLRNEMTNNIRDTAARLEIALKEAQNANVAKSAFLANMSHEMRTPMNVILGITEILMRNEMLGVDTLDSLNKIYNSGDLLLGIINDILDLSKIDAGKLELAPSEYKITSLINDTVTLNMMRIGSKPIEFKISIDENIPSNLIGDELRIKQILTNLLSNSFKYTEKGTVKLSIDIAADKTAEDSCVTLVFKISDTGQGMNEEQVSRLFDEYSRFNIEVNRTTEGTGLGMSITRTLLQMMKGTIAVESEQGKGTTVIVCLPQKVTGSGVVGKEL
ncbi:MAG: PAS domain S-box protein, partial [Treponema sp.]|nr:PAS domain S-box protein [Treponema sp.]